LKNKEILKLNQRLLKQWLELVYHNVLFFSAKKKELKVKFGPSFEDYDTQVRTGVILPQISSNLEDSIYTTNNNDDAMEENKIQEEEDIPKDNLLI
jgi:hypothetical protein